MRKVYFSGSIRGGRGDAELYHALIGTIQEEALVLTEHIGDPAYVSPSPGQERDRAIYEKDTAFLQECDLVIAECTVPSLGVGYELAYAEHLGKPVHILYRPKDSKLSAMLGGNPSFRLYPYETEKEARKLIRDILSSKV